MTIASMAPQQAPSISTRERGKVENRLPSFVGLASINGGLVVDEDGMTVIEAIQRAGLNFTVHAHESQTPVPLPDGGTRIVPDGKWLSTVRKDPDGTMVVLGKVRGRHRIMQNTDAFAFGQMLVDDYGANVAAAGQFGDPIGSGTFMALRLDQALTIAGKDPYDLYVLIRNAHDGSSQVVVSIIPIRRASGAEILTSLRGAPQSWTFRHSGNLERKVDQAVNTAELVKTWIDTYTQVTYDMLATRLTRPQFEAFATRLYPTPRGASEKSAKDWAQRRSVLLDLFLNADTNSFGRGTVYAAFCAVSEYIDHYAVTRGGDPARIRATRNMTGRADKVKEQAWNLLAAMI